jgi:membrane protease YdiL (CAAX protease family)
MAAVLLTIALVAYNNVANRWPPFNRAAYVPANVLAGSVLWAVAVGPLGLSAASLGLADLAVGDLLLGTGLGLALTLLLFVGLLFERTRRVIADRRVAGLGGARLLYQAAIRVPIGTAAFEELAFRGALFAAWRQVASIPLAALISSVAFGLWHVAPTLNLIAANKPGLGPRARIKAVGATVVAMTAAGLALVWLRLESGSLALPWALHATLNSLATVAAVMAGKKGPGSDV